MIADQRTREIRMAQAVNLGFKHIRAYSDELLLPEEFDEEIKLQARRYYKILTELWEEVINTTDSDKQKLKPIKLEL